jgi:hypothetical protein
VDFFNCNLKVIFMSLKLSKWKILSELKKVPHKWNKLKDSNYTNVYLLRNSVTTFFSGLGFKVPKSF